MELFGMDTIGWILVAVALGVFIILGGLINTYYMLKERYCSYCGAFRKLEPYNNRVLRKVLRYRSICGNDSCEVHQLPPISKKGVDAFGIVMAIWMPFYFVFFRLSVLTEVTVDVFYADLFTGIMLVLFFFLTRRFYTQKIHEMQPTEGL